MQVHSAMLLGIKLLETKELFNVYWHLNHHSI